MSTLSTAFSTLAAYRELATAALRCQFPPARRATPGEARVGIVVWDFAPSISGGVYRPAALARHLAHEGFDTQVVAGPAPAQPSPAGQQLLAQLGGKVAIQRVSESSRATSFRFFPRTDGGLLNALELFNAARDCWKDAPPEVIIATGPPFSTFVAGAHLARYFGSRLILDYRDEWSLNPFEFVWKSRQDERLEARCLAQADRVVLTTASQKALLEQKYPEILPGKCLVIANGWESEGKTSERPDSPALDGKILLLFAGKLGGHTRPDDFLGSLETLLRENPALLEKLVVRFVGNKNPAAQASLARFPYPQVIENWPLVPLQEVQSMMLAADALLLFHDRNFERYLPGKLYEYLASRKPILLLDDCGESGRLVDSLNAGWSMNSSDVGALHHTVLSMLEAKSGRAGKPDLVNERLDAWLRDNTRTRMATRFQECIAALRGSGSVG